jgi:NAD(P)-dependent dehydrogenase (short-subunit alcohol dehydrogenase family)
MPRENGFENKRVVIVGGSSGIGLAVAEQAASQGADVVIVSSKAERVQEAIQSIGGDVGGQAVDASDEGAVEGFFAKLGAFDHLVFTAGDSLQLHELADTDLKQARRAFELRYWSALATVKYGSPQIRNGGSIVLTTGVAGPTPTQWMGNCRKCLRNYRSVNTCPGD